MEAKLKTTDDGAADRSSEEIRRARCLAALDRYLKAVGIGDEKARHRLARSAFETIPGLCARGACHDWESMIAAVDQVLCAEHQIDSNGDAQTACEGRIAERCRHSSRLDGEDGRQAVAETGRALPVQCRRQMAAQDLSVSRPARQCVEAALAVPSELWRTQLLRLQLWRPVQGLTLGILCLVVVLVP